MSRNNVYLRDFSGKLQRLEFPAAINCEHNVYTTDIAHVIQQRYHIPIIAQRIIYKGQYLDLHNGSRIELGRANEYIELELHHLCGYYGLRGGKGGFGSMLRAAGKVSRTTNKHAMRDLSGRRHRFVDQEKELLNWVEMQRKISQPESAKEMQNDFRYIKRYGRVPEKRMCHRGNECPYKYKCKFKHPNDQSRRLFGNHDHDHDHTANANTNNTDRTPKNEVLFVQSDAQLQSAMRMGRIHNERQKKFQRTAALRNKPLLQLYGTDMDMDMGMGMNDGNEMLLSSSSEETHDDTNINENENTIETANTIDTKDTKQSKQSKQSSEHTDANVNKSNVVVTKLPKTGKKNSIGNPKKEQPFAEIDIIHDGILIAGYHKHKLICTVRSDCDFVICDHCEKEFVGPCFHCCESCDFDVCSDCLYLQMDRNATTADANNNNDQIQRNGKNANAKRNTNAKNAHQNGNTKRNNTNNSNHANNDGNSNGIANANANANAINTEIESNLNSSSELASIQASKNANESNCNNKIKESDVVMNLNANSSSGAIPIEDTRNISLFGDDSHGRRCFDANRMIIDSDLLFLDCVAESVTSVPMQTAAAANAPANNFTANSKNDTNIKEIDLKSIATMDELQVFGLDALKEKLRSYGLKCSGTLQQRAERLWLLKTHALSEIQKRHFAKKRAVK